MRKLYLLIFSVCLGLISNAQPCIPDSTVKTGVSPSGVMPNDTVGIPYHEVITLVVPSDTSLSSGGTTYNIRIDSARVLKIDSIPRGFSYECNKSSCTWKGGEKGCAILKGMADSSQTKTYHIWLYVVSYFELVLNPGQQFQRLDSSLIYFSVAGGWPTSVSNLAEKPVKLKLYPNPAHNSLKVELNNMLNEKPVFEIYDMSSRLVFMKSFESPVYSYWAEEIDISSFDKGLYFAVLRSRNGISQSRLIIQ